MNNCKLTHIDTAVIILVSFLIALVAHNLLLMTIVVPLILLLRLILATTVAADRLPVSHELILFTACTVIGAFNDWNSVVNHGIYDYTVPVYFPGLTTVPIWMLLFWGMILRYFVTLGSTGFFKPDAENRLWLGRSVAVPGWVRVAVLLAIAMVTRQFIYRFYLDPFYSWLPFAVALGFWLIVVPTGKGGRRLVLAALVAGPLVEGLYILVGGMHLYHLPFVLGVPLWIMLWWTLAVPLWVELAGRGMAILVHPRIE